MKASNGWFHAFSYFIPILMKLRNLIFLPILGGMLFTSCTSIYRATYTVENIKGGAIIDEKNMLADYGKFSIQYATNGDVVIVNNTDSTMFVDMAESYYVGNGVAERLFTNSVTTNYTSGTRGATVNLGSVANALNVGGIAGTIAQGVNLGGSNTSGTATQVFEERHISIPPFSRQSIKSKNFSLGYQEAKKIKKSGIYNYDKSNSFVNEYIFAYTFDPNASTFLSTRDLIHISQIEKTNHINGFKVGEYYKKDYNKNEVFGECLGGKDILSVWGLVLGGMGAIFGIIFLLC